LFVVQYKIVWRRKRDAYSSFAPVWEDRGPRVEGERTLDLQVGANQMSPEHTASETFELDTDDVPWTDALEELEEQPEVNIESGEVGGFKVNLIHD
jgi:hypothetical protein